MWVQVKVNPVQGFGGCGDDIIPCDGLSEGEDSSDDIVTPEKVTIWLDKQMQSWPGFHRCNVPWFQLVADWNFDGMAQTLQQSPVLTVGSQLMVVILAVSGQMTKSAVRRWVDQVCHIMLEKQGCPCLAFVTAIPVEGEQKMDIKNFNCNLITAVHKLQKKVQGRSMVVVPIHQFILKSDIAVNSYDQLSIRDCCGVMQALLIMLRHTFPGLGAVHV